MTSSGRCLVGACVGEEEEEEEEEKEDRKSKRWLSKCPYPSSGDDIFHLHVQTQYPSHLALARALVTLQIPRQGKVHGQLGYPYHLQSLSPVKKRLSILSGCHYDDGDDRIDIGA